MKSYASVILLIFLEQENQSFFLNQKILLVIGPHLQKIAVFDRNQNISDAQCLNSSRVLGMRVRAYWDAVPLRN
jgi:hypothetical protein